MTTKAIRTAGISGACALLAASAVIAAAPTADAATTTHCTAGNSSALTNGYPLNYVRTTRTYCPDFTDSGSPYTLVIDRLDILIMDPWGQSSTIWYNVTATCGSVREDPGGILYFNSCTYRST
ncbi:hypothetical protein AB0G64_29110 [Streptomyces longwoodensis]|uniref:hypothetical protein n=1 Tax=Streptomyces longwoodensis TaxID=68231 RepID=UPI0033F761D1